MDRDTQKLFEQLALQNRGRSSNFLRGLKGKHVRFDLSLFDGSQQHSWEGLVQDVGDNFIFFIDLEEKVLRALNLSHVETISLVQEEEESDYYVSRRGEDEENDEIEVEIVGPASMKKMTENTVVRKPKAREPKNNVKE